jgi:hypothetical protein
MKRRISNIRRCILRRSQSQFWGPFIRINDNLINKYNNPGPVGGPR